MYHRGHEHACRLPGLTYLAGPSPAAADRKRIAREAAIHLRHCQPPQTTSYGVAATAKGTLRCSDYLLRLTLLTQAVQTLRKTVRRSYIYFCRPEPQKSAAS